ncbi:MFS transporter [Thermosulfurimonas dismutans]|uniref:AmpG permease n=1 Tax=Thermosulfurimonas dismutans TaxID=999894 RepID=A0A179D514_9BACT|nr:MFS transporter [Thermosulfurimonas dismutans]OAQ21175.1 AmpG permease [Thermosulfurimonas dismutans]
MRDFYRKMMVVALLYLAEGLPFGFVYVTLPVYLRSEGVNLIEIGLLSLAGLSWSLKPLWAPLVDRYGQKYHWMVGALLGLGLSVALLSLVPPAGKLYILFVFLCTLSSATLDIAVDGYTIELLTEEELGPGNGVRVSAYRVAMIGSGGGLVALSHFLGFKPAFLALTVVFLALAGLILILPDTKKPSITQKTYNIFEQYLLPLKDFLKRPYALAILFFVLFFKIGDATMGSMIYPFWVDRGFTKLEIGLISGTLGSIATIVGSLVGGGLIRYLGLFRALWMLGLTQSLSNLGYAYAALPDSARWTVYGASIIESFTGGLGTAAFLAFLMRLCRKDMSASQYALLSTLFSLSFTLSRALGGFGAEYLGYASFFFLTFWISLPPLLLVPLVIKAVPREKTDRNHREG